MNAGGLMSIFHKDSTWDKVRKPLGKAAASGPARSGLTAFAAALALSVASAATSAARRRKEGT
jgi:hypothetical protein